MNRCDISIYSEVQKTSDEIFDELRMSEKNVSDPNSCTLYKYLNDDEEQKTNNVLVWQKNSDESFEALERMCDKTASDPNSTLFQYLNSESKEQILSEVKKRSADGKYLNTRNQEDQLLMKISNCTLLDDVEAPSRMWENSICGDNVLQTSPVKMVGLLRPSTIIEETPNDSTNSDLSSHISFRTAMKIAQSDVSSSVYETAHDSTVGSNKTDFSNKFYSQEEQFVDINEASEQRKKFDEAVHNPSLEKIESAILETTTLINICEGENINDISVDLIDLENAYGPEENNVDSYNKLDDSIIEILSDNEADEVEEKQDRSKYIRSIKKHEDIDTETEISSQSFVVHYDTYYENDKQNYNETQESLQKFNQHVKSDLSLNSFIDINEYPEKDKENCAGITATLERSIQFNDTMEEVEYMLKRGMEYIAADAAAKKNLEKLKEPLPVIYNKGLKPQQNSPTKQMNKNIPYSSSKALSTYTSPAKKAPLIKGHNSTSKRFDIDIKPFPKLDVFDKYPLHDRAKELAMKQQKYSHIISPIGTYMNKTAKAPLMSSMYCKNKDYFNSSAILELENESRLYQPQFTKDSNGGETLGLQKLPGVSSVVKQALPKKAYISSDLKHIVDERTPVTIPGGKKIQKYLESALMPAVLRHDGKFKMPASTKLPLKVSNENSVSTQSTSHIPKRVNASLADLSLMSGDVSMYTIMDAQKF